MKKVYKIMTCGYYISDAVCVNGQSIRTESVTNELKKKLGNDAVKQLSYGGIRKHPFKFLLDFIGAISKSEALIIFPDTNAMKYLVPFSLVVCRIFNVSLYYNVIGGWLPGYLEKKFFYRRCLDKFDALFVQTAYLKRELNKQGLNNVVVFPNFKNIKIFSSNDLAIRHGKPYKVYFMSRILPEKGIEYLIEAIKEVNREKIKYELDIYGPVESGYEETFNKIMAQVPSYINYNGVVKPLETSLVASKYFLHIFPTTFFAEGFAGSVIDSMAAGVPTLASKWPSFDDCIDEGKTGLSYEYGSKADLICKLEMIYENSEIIDNMRENCLAKAKEYQPDVIIDIMIKKVLGAV